MRLLPHVFIIHRFYSENGAPELCQDWKCEDNACNHAEVVPEEQGMTEITEKERKFKPTLSSQGLVWYHWVDQRESSSRLVMTIKVKSFSKKVEKYGGV